MSQRARETLAELLRPESYDRFFDEFVGRKMLHVHEGDGASRARILGDNPAGVILEGYEDLAHTVTCHSGSATQRPPKARRVKGPDEFRALIREFHNTNYTVRIPKVTSLSPRLMELCRALEILFENPASPGIFWSAAGANAPIHHDEVDLIIIQLTGKKRWFISADAPTLPNTWKVAGEGAPPLERHHVIDVVPGDVLYLPRGTSHTVESTTESIHVSIGFLPVTVREAVSALVDYFSESERAVRAGVAKRADDLANGKRDNDIAATLRASLKALLERCQSDEFIHAALERRRARMIEDLPKITPAAGEAQVRPESRVRHHPLAVAHVLAVGDSVDFRQPGERILVHRGAEEALRFIVQTPEFRVSEIPGPLGDEVKVALVSRLLTSGFLQTA